MNRLLALIQREYWENKGTFRTTPLVVGGIYVALQLMAMFTTAHIDDGLYTFKDGLSWMSMQSMELRESVMHHITLGASVFFTVVMSFVIFFYLLGALYDDRKDRSILFWKSLPASDTLTLLSKLLAAMVLAPVSFFLVLVATQLVMALIGSLMIWYVGLSPWEVFLSAWSPLHDWGLILSSWLAQSIWALPAFGWLLLVSAFAPRVPLLFATLPPLLLGILQTWIEFLRTFTLQNNIVGVVGSWLANTPAILTAEFGSIEGEASGELALGVPLTGDFDHSVTLANMLDRIFSLQMLAGLAVALLFLGLALWLRRRATDG